MTDGAHQNIGAEDAMKFIVGGEDYPESQTDEQFERMIREAPTTGPAGSLGYSEGANATARILLEAYEKYPQLRELPEGHEYLREPDGSINWSRPIYLNVDLYEVIKKLHPEHEQLFLSLSGFMWGWAMNAARKILNLGPVPNPAIMTIGSE